MRITVVTPSIRPEGLEIVAKSLVRQNFRRFEWLLGTPFVPKVDTEGIDDFEWIKDDFKGGSWSLNRIYNKMFKKAQGDIIVTLQDWIWISPDGLQKFVDALEFLGGEGIVSGVGDQYERMGDFKPEVKIWNDPRKNTEQGTFYECYPNDVEWNWCAFPKKYIFKIGGMDEKLDVLGFGGDQLQVGERWDALGYKSYLDQDNESFTVRHDRSDFGGEDLWNENHTLFNGQYDKRKEELIKKGKWPVLSYLS